jgi:23S rRNA (pseudouridine1915-N3)-methyltransferase
VTVSVQIIAVGKNKDSALQSLIDDYTKRLSWRVIITEINPPQTDDETRKSREAALIEKAIPDKSVIIALDERGENTDSITFAKKLDTFITNKSPSLTFIIGGADGLDELIRKRADLLISFGKLTWPHMLVRLMLVEQLYRATTILSGHPYHRQ